jgi:hypothetical protein
MEFPNSTNGDRFNAKIRLDHPEFQALIREAEEEINAALWDPELVARLIEEHEQNMKDSIGEDMYLQEAAVTGFVYETDEDEEPTGVQNYIWVDESVFHAIRMIKVGDTYKALLQVTTDQYFDEQDIFHDKEMYFMAPDAIDNFEILIEEPFMEIIARHIDIGRRIITDPSFYSLSIEFQTDILNQEALRLDIDLPYLEGFGVAFDASRYIVLHDMGASDIRDGVIDQSTENREDRIQPRGQYRECLYPELAYTKGPFRRIEEFDISGGSPCIVIRNDTLGVTYLVPIEAIENHDDTYLEVYDQQDQE